jgi:hypothetical protein
MDRSKIIILGVAIAATGIIIYMMYRRYNFDAHVTDASCYQLCNIAHPGDLSACSGSNGSNRKECASYHKCVSECELDQSQAIAQRDPSDWHGPYGSLI